MTKYLFLLAFILPFMVMGQKKPCNKCWPKIDTTKQEFCVDGSPITGGTISIIMPTVDGNKNGVMETFAVNGAFSCGPGIVTIGQPQKDSIVKGWIVYYKKGFVTKQWTTMCYSTLNGHYPIKVSSTRQGVQQVIKEATAHYKRSYGDALYIDNYGHFKQAWEIYKILVDGKPFDMSKYYEFIPDLKIL